MIFQRMSRLMVEMDWDYVTVIYSDDSIGKHSLELFQSISKKYYFCIDKSIAVSDSDLTINDVKSVGVVLLGSEGIGM